MSRHSAANRRANRQPGYKRMDREEYVSRAYELAPRGETLAKKLTAEKVRAIRANVKGMTDKQQAELYGVHANTIYSVRKRLTWACVQ